MTSSTGALAPLLAKAPLEPENIQSDVLGGHGFLSAAPPPARGGYVFLRFQDQHGQPTPQAALQQFFRDHVPTWANAWQDLRLNVGFTHHGLKVLLGRPETAQLLAQVGEPFEDLAATMARRAEALGDVPEQGDTRPAQSWSLSDGEARADGVDYVDAVVLVFGTRSDEGAHRLAERIGEAARKAGLRAHVRFGTALADQREHFGFVDGISQPLVTGVEVDPTPGRDDMVAHGHGVVDGNGVWRRLQPGEIVLGYDDEEGAFDGSPLLRNGTFFVLRRIEQNVAAFQDWLAAEEARVGMPQPELAARLMGRRYDGEPLVSPGDGGLNDFRFAQDPDGAQCPFGAHIRRTNPRDMSGRLADRSERHRMLRRTLTFAERPSGEYVPVTTSRGWQRSSSSAASAELTYGMWFGCFCANIGRQFEVVQGGWVNGGESAPRKLFTRDPIAGTNPCGTGDFILPGPEVRVLKNVASFTKTAGGAYFFVPGRHAYHLIVGLPAPVEQGAVEQGAAEQPRLEQDVFASWGRRQERRAPPSVAHGGTARQISQALGYAGRSTPRDGRRAHPAPSSLDPRELIRHQRDHSDVTPEEQTLVLFAAIRSDQVDEARRMLGPGRAQLDAALDQVLYTFYGDGPRPSIHHARFLITAQFQRFGPVDPARPRAGSRIERDLLPGGHHLLFVCKYDGTRSELVRALAERGRALPFYLCRGCPSDPSESVLRFRYFVATRELPVAFAYQAYSAPAYRVRRALTLRERFVSLVADLTAQDSAAKAPEWIQEFFERTMPGAGAPAQSPSPAREKRSK